MVNKNQETVRVRLPRIGNEDDSVIIYVGEKTWRIRRGDEVEIPLCAYDVLRNAELAEDAAVAYIRKVAN